MRVAAWWCRDRSRHGLGRTALGLRVKPGTFLASTPTTLVPPVISVRIQGGDKRLSPAGKPLNTRPDLNEGLASDLTAGWGPDPGKVIRYVNSSQSSSGDSVICGHGVVPGEREREPGNRVVVR